MPIKKNIINRGGEKMSLTIFDNDNSKKNHCSITTTKHQVKFKSLKERQESESGAQKLKENKRVIKEQDKEFAYSYMIDDQGSKVLINKVQLDQMENQSNFKNVLDASKINSTEYNLAVNAPSALGFHQLNLEAHYRSNIQDARNVINENDALKSSSRQIQKILKSLKM
jgi:hypothetical protein